MMGIAKPALLWAIKTKAAVRVTSGEWCSWSDRSPQRWAYLENYTHPLKNGLCDNGTTLVLSICRDVKGVTEKIELGSLIFNWMDVKEVNQGLEDIVIRVKNSVIVIKDPNYSEIFKSGENEG